MKKLLFSLAAFALIFSACGGGDDDPTTPEPKQEETPTITIDSSVTTNGLSFTSEAGEKSLTFTASDAWTLSVATTRSGASWCTPSQTSGGAGTVTVKFTVTANDTYDDRSVTITIKCGTVTISFTITQKAADALLVTKTKYELGQEGGTIEVEVKANIDYQMEIAASAQVWITQASTRALTARTYKFNVAANEELAQREGEIHFKSGDKLETVKVYQSGATPVLVLGQKEITVSDAGETISVDVKSNVEFDVQMPSVSWITEAATRGMSSHTVKFTVQPNTDYDSRTAQIIFLEKNGALKDTLTVTQAQKDAIILAEKEMSIAAKGGALTVKLKANVDVTTTIAEDCKDWITLPATRGLVDKDVTLQIAENTSYDARTGNVTFSANGILETVTITQEAKQIEPDPVLEVSTKEYTVEAVGGKVTITFTSNVSVTLSVAEDCASWLKIETIELDYMIKSSILSVAENTSNESRSGVVTIQAGNLSEKVTITQLGKGKLILEELNKHNSLTIDGILYTEDLEVLQLWGMKSAREVLDLSGATIYNNVLPKGTFGACNIRAIYLPTDLTTIEKYAFADSYVEEVRIPDSVNFMGEGTFYGCYELKKADLPQSLTSVESLLFASCQKLKSCNIPKGVTFIGREAFEGCISLAELTIPEGVKTIEHDAFAYCKDLTSIVIPSSVTSIAEYAFRNCSKLGGSIVIPKGMTVIETGLFYCCDNIEQIVLPESIITIKKNAFSDCESLKNINIPHNITSIENFTFDGCKSLTAINIPNGVKSIEPGTFIRCSGLKEVSIPGSVKSIGEIAFWECSALESISIPEGVTYIGGEAFRDCTLLKTISLPKSLTEISYNILSFCMSLSSIYCYATTPPKCYSTASFVDIPADCKLYVPKGCKSTYEETEGWKGVFSEIIEMNE